MYLFLLHGRSGNAKAETLYKCPVCENNTATASNAPTCTTGVSGTCSNCGNISIPALGHKLKKKYEKIEGNGSQHSVWEKCERTNCTYTTTPKEEKHRAYRGSLEDPESIPNRQSNI